MLQKKVRQFLREESGQALTEYLLLFVIAIGLAVQFLQGILDLLKEMANQFADAMEKDLSTGTCGTPSGGVSGNYQYPDDCFRDISKWGNK